MKLLIETQQNPVGSEVLARIAIVRPILMALLTGIKQEVLNELGGMENMKLFMLPRAYRDGYGDVGFCFEWAIHDAIRRKDPMVMERLADASKLCKLPGNSFQSILFGVEKSGKTRIIDTANQLLTDDSRILTGAQAQPPKLKSYMNMLAAAFHRPETRAALPSSINGLWKADLFFGSTDKDRWLGTTLKINAKHLEGARGLRVGIVPATQGAPDKIYKDDTKNLIVCPIPYDGSFMELFYTGWRIVQQFITADAKVPPPVALPAPADRQVAKELEMRREFPIVDVIQALEAQSQTDLLKATEKSVDVTTEREGNQILNDLVISPVASYKPT
ncbi:hypothetical protein [Burkholderia paludis]|uniref:hypothetical protein n=1 Tax=Burkholderia paludis TaxID=1506587 RepID=UPI000946C638|nr:hypothetical protein [Burkholderia paludis]